MVEGVWENLQIKLKLIIESSHVVYRFIWLTVYLKISKMLKAVSVTWTCEIAAAFFLSFTWPKCLCGERQILSCIYSCFLEGFYCKWMLNFVQGFLCIYWDNHMVFIFQFVNVVYYIDWCVDIEESLHPWDNAQTWS